MECVAPAPWAIVVGHPDAEAFVTDAVRDLLRIMGDASLTASRRAAAFASAVNRLTDVGYIMDQILGEPGMPTFAERQGLAAALSQEVGRVYDGRLWRGPMDGVTLLGSTSPRPDEVVVTFAINDTRASAPIQMSWRVLRSTGGWRLIDVECGGVWLVGARQAASARRSRE
jgi:phospholipid transport system substrate-binding protein